MKIPMLMAGAAVLAFATSAMAQDAASPAAPDTSAAQAAPAPDATTTDNASTGPASTTAPAANTAASTAATPTDNATAAAPPASDAATAVAPAPTDAATAAAPSPTDAATAAAPPATDAATAAATPAPGAAVDPAKTQAADQMIAQNWSKYDQGNKGNLTPLEFGSWVLAAQGNDMTAQIEKSRHSRSASLPSTKVLNATSAEFSKADTNKDRTISQDELRTYLAG